MVSSKPPFLLLCAIARLTTTIITLTPLANVLVSLQYIGLLSFSHNTPATQAPGCARHTRRCDDAVRLSRVCHSDTMALSLCSYATRLPRRRARYIGVGAQLWRAAAPRSGGEA